MNTNTNPTTIATPTAGMKAAATRRAKLALAAQGHAPMPTMSAGEKAAMTRRMKAAAAGHAVQVETLSYKVAALPGATLVRKLEDGEVVWKLMVGGAFRGEAIELASGRWAAATATQQLGDRFESRQAAVARLVTHVKAQHKAAADVKVAPGRVTCPKGHGSLAALKGGEYLWCATASHLPRLHVGQEAIRVGLFEVVDGQPVELTTVRKATER
jgi:hypothetical protein